MAINPVDWFMQDMGIDLFSYLKYPMIGGMDLAGEVVEVGGAVSTFKPGDRVVGCAFGVLKNDCPRAAFQQYSLVVASMASRIPVDMTYESACVLPVCLATAASGMFQKDRMALEYPSLSPKPTGKTVMIWGGSTSVGSNAIQLAVAAGYDVITTASPRNFEYVKKLGASQALDYNSETIIDDLVIALDGKTVAGIMDANGHSGSVDSCVKVAGKCPGDTFIAASRDMPKGDLPPGVQVEFIWGNIIAQTEVGEKVFVEYLPEALAKGEFVPAPDPEVVGKGLGQIQIGFEAQKKGVSAKKIVVSL